MTPAHIDCAPCPGTRHGTSDAFKRFGCRCPDARVAYRRYKKQQRVGLLARNTVDATGTARRIQALFADGHSAPRLAYHLSLRSTSLVFLLAHHKHATVHITTAIAVRRLCHLLADQPAPQGRGPTLVRRVAANHGWVTLDEWYDAGADIDDPAAWPARDLPDDDEPDHVVVDRLLAGAPVSVSRVPDRLAAARVLLQRGVPRNQVSLRLRLRHSVVTEMAALLAA